jgi:hypothetical protein
LENFGELLEDKLLPGEEDFVSVLSEKFEKISEQEND